MSSHSEMMKDCFSSSMYGRKETEETRVQMLKYSMESTAEDQTKDCQERKNRLERGVGSVNR